MVGTCVVIYETSYVPLRMRDLEPNRKWEQKYVLYSRDLRVGHTNRLLNSASGDRNEGEANVPRPVLARASESTVWRLVSELPRELEGYSIYSTIVSIASP